MFRGLEGFGASSRIHTSRLLSLSEDLPLAIIIVDTAERTEAFLDEVAELVTGGRAPARYLADGAVQARHDTVFRWGTFAVNMAGSALLGFLLGAQRRLGLPPAAVALLGTDFCGGLTTLSTFGYETLRLLEDGAVAEAGMNVLGSLAVGVLLAWLGFLLAGALLSAVPPVPR